MTPKDLDGRETPAGSMKLDAANIWPRVVTAAFVVLVLLASILSIWLYKSEQRNDQLMDERGVIVGLLNTALTSTEARVRLLEQSQQYWGELLRREGPRAYVEELGER